MNLTVYKGRKKEYIKLVTYKWKCTSLQSHSPSCYISPFPQ